MTLAKTKRDGSADPEQVFRSLEAQLRGPDWDFPSRWLDVAGQDEDARRWIIDGLDLLARNADAAGPDFDGPRAASLLVDKAKARTGAEHEVLAMSGWLESALVASLTRPSPTGLFTSDGRFDPARLTADLLPVLVERLVADRDALAGDDDEDPAWIRRTAGEVEALIRADPSMWAVARADGPFHDGYSFADNVLPSEARPTGDRDVLDHLRQQVHVVGRDPSAGSLLDGYDHAVHRAVLDDVLLGWLDGYPDLADLCAELIEVSPAHHDAQRGAIYVPTVRWAGEAEWRPWLRRTMLHEFLHRLAHPAYLDRADRTPDPQILREGVVEVLTADLLPEADEIGYGTSGAAAVELYRQAGPDRLKAAYFLGRTEFIGLP
ncbi:hypothetical protein [Herbidospora cretacea]|uniref:hypothetical protein n=1 Tax=Herbidospora cretacea TaxID=28444 RepID=UPI0007735F2F|nr:hypothetical protein [Herbidospora cretacea]